MGVIQCHGGDSTVAGGRRGPFPETRRGHTLCPSLRRLAGAALPLFPPARVAARTNVTSETPQKPATPPPSFHTKSTAYRQYSVAAGACRWRAAAWARRVSARATRPSALHTAALRALCALAASCCGASPPRCRSRRPPRCSRLGAPPASLVDLAGRCGSARLLAGPPAERHLCTAQPCSGPPHSRTLAAEPGLSSGLGRLAASTSPHHHPRNRRE